MEPKLLLLFKKENTVSLFVNVPHFFPSSCSPGLCQNLQTQFTSHLHQLQNHPNSTEISTARLHDWYIGGLSGKFNSLSHCFSKHCHSHLSCLFYIILWLEKWAETHRPAFCSFWLETSRMLFQTAGNFSNRPHPRTARAKTSIVVM